MFAEIALWTLSILGASYALPYCVPPIRMAQKQLHELVKTNTVFTSNCITDIQQAQIDMIDRTIGQIMGASCQFMIVAWAFLNLLFTGPIEPLHDLVISYYLYDMIHLYMKPYGRRQSIFFLHHTLSICMIAYIRYTQIEYTTLSHSLYILMESSGCALNITNLYKQFYPASKHIITCSSVNIIIYGLTRVLVYPLILSYYEYQLYISVLDTKYIYIFPNALLILLFCVSVWWFIAMVQKHRGMKQKTIL
jgi:hypothetical protein